MKFRTLYGMGIAQCDQKAARDCYLRACRTISEKDMRVHSIAERASNENSLSQLKSAVEREEVVLEVGWLDKKIKIGTGLHEDIREVVIRVLDQYKVVFAWGPEDMPGVDWFVVTHRLAVDPSMKPVKQNKRYMSADRREFVRKEVSMLMAVEHVSEVEYHE